MQDVRVAIVYDGKYHPVDSSEEVAFVAAGEQGVPRCDRPRRDRSCWSRSSGVEINCPAATMGDVTGDLVDRVAAR